MSINMKLSLARLADLAREDIRQVKRVDASKKGIHSLDDLSACVDLERLDLSRNNLRSLEGLADCQNLKWLNIAFNQIEELKHLRHMTCLKVLNATGNGIKSVQSLAKLKALQALILGSNDIAVASGIDSFIQLNTLVLSKNRLDSIAVSRLTNLEKLSLSHNEFHSFPDISALQLLKELRLNDNKIQLIPESIYLNARLIIVDVGNNRIRDFEALRPLGSLKMMTNLNLKGNVVCTSSHYVHKVVSIAQAVKILDGRQLAIGPAVTPKGKPVGIPDRQTGGIVASKKTGKKQKTVRMEALVTSSASCRLTHNDKTYRKKSHKKHSKGSHAITDSMDSLTTQSSSQPEHLETVQSESTKSRRTTKTKRSFGSNEDDTTTQHSHIWVAGSFITESLGGRQSRKRKWITEGRVPTGVESDQKGKLTKKEEDDEDIFRNKTESKQKMHKERHPMDTKGKSALKSRDSGVVAIKEIRKKKHKPKYSMFKPDILLQSSNDFGVGGTSAW